MIVIFMENSYVKGDSLNYSIVWKCMCNIDFCLIYVYLCVVWYIGRGM